MLLGQHFDGKVPRNLNHVFLRPFEHGFNKKIGTLMFKNQNDGATLTLPFFCTGFFFEVRLVFRPRAPLQEIINQLGFFSRQIISSFDSRLALMVLLTIAETQRVCTLIFFFIAFLQIIICYYCLTKIWFQWKRGGGGGEFRTKRRTEIEFVWTHAHCNHVLLEASSKPMLD